jgi:hypothetical protein
VASALTRTVAVAQAVSTASFPLASFANRKKNPLEPESAVPTAAVAVADAVVLEAVAALVAAMTVVAGLALGKHGRSEPFDHL